MNMLVHMMNLSFISLGVVWKLHYRTFTIIDVHIVQGNNMWYFGVATHFSMFKKSVLLRVPPVGEAFKDK